MSIGSTPPTSPHSTATPNGHRPPPGAATLTPQSLEAIKFLRSVEVHDELPSTNTRAIELCRLPGLQTPALVVAHRQTAGRGRGGARWHSSEGSLTFSLALAPEQWRLGADANASLALATALSVCDAVDEIQGAYSESADFDAKDKARVKWPNDVYLGRRKLCGVLIEAPVVSPPRLVVGVGVNVNNLFAGAARELAGDAVSLRDAVGPEIDLRLVLERILISLEQRLDQLASGCASLVADVNARSALSGCRVTVSTPGGAVKGRCIGLAPDGALLVDDGAQVTRIISGTVLEWRGA